MRKLMLSAALVASVMFVAVSCSPYGEKVKINEKSEVYYKDGGTKEEATKLGDFLLRNNYFDTSSDKSVQVTKEKDTSVVKFVVDEEKLKNTPNADMLFGIMQMLIKDSIFNGKPTKVILANDGFKTLRAVKAFEPDTKATDSSAATADSTNQ